MNKILAILLFVFWALILILREWEYNYILMCFYGGLIGSSAGALWTYDDQRNRYIDLSNRVEKMLGRYGTKKNE